MSFTDPADIRTADFLDTLFDIERARGVATQSTGHLINAASLHRLYADLADLASARIEGNNTTVRDALMRPKQNNDEQLRELDNLRAATKWVIAHANESPITHETVRRIHEIVVDGLTREGDEHPGVYRTAPVRISNTKLIPSVPAAIHGDMDSLLNDINREVSPRLQIAHIAQCHHRFSVIHPFANGNGRTGRLLTMAHLMRSGFGFAHNLPLTPTAVFGRDRETYYRKLAAADFGGDQGVQEWVEFVANGIRDDMNRLVALQDHDFVMDAVVEPALTSALAAGTISKRDSDVARMIIDRGTLTAPDLSVVLPGSPSSRSQKLRAIVDSGLVQPVTVNARTYQAPLHTGPLVMHVMTALDKAGLLPAMVRH